MKKHTRKRSLQNLHVVQLHPWDEYTTALLTAALTVCTSVGCTVTQP